MDKTFPRIDGQEIAKKIMRDGVTKTRPPHAWLLTGLPGSGAMEASIELAKAMVCSNREPLPCGQCDSCRRITGGNYLDLHVIQPQNNYLRIEQVRQMIVETNIAPVEAAGLKIFVVQDLQQMQAVGQNAMLKSLEEPWPQVRFILVATLLQAVLPTVISRCRQVPFFPYTRKEVEVILKREGAKEPEIIATLSGGDLVLAREISSGSTEYLRTRDVAIRLLGLVQSEEWLLTRFEKEAAAVKDQSEVLYRAMLTWMHDLLAMRLGANPAILRNGDLLPRLQGEAYRWHPGYLARGIRQVAISNDRLKRNANYKLEISRLGLELRELAQRSG